jgi:hypothetical protein
VDSTSITAIDAAESCDRVHHGETTHESVSPTAAAALEAVCNDAWAHILTFCENGSLLAMASTCRSVRHFVLSLDTVLWLPRCASLWEGKLLFDLRYRGVRFTQQYPLPRAKIPRQLVRSLLRATGLAAPAPPETFTQGLAMHWRAAYFLSRRDAKRDFLVDDELFEHDWAVQFLARGAAGVIPGGAQPAGPRVFRRIGRVNVVQPAASLPAVPCQLYDGGRRVQVDIFPTHRVERSEDWGWRIVNAFVRFETGRPADVPLRSPSLAPETARGPAGANTTLVHLTGGATLTQYSAAADSDEDDDGGDAANAPLPDVVLQGLSGPLVLPPSMMGRHS